MADLPETPEVDVGQIAPDVTVLGQDLSPEIVTPIGLAQQRGGVALARVTFYSGTDLFEVNGATGGDSLDGDLISVVTNKDLAAPAGSFVITLHDRPIRSGRLKGRLLSDAIAPMDLVVISFGRRDAEGPGALPLQAAMIGFVGQAPTEVETIGDGGVATHQLVVQGFDFGKLFLNAVLTYFKDVPNADIRNFAARNLQYLKNGKFPAGPKSHIMAWVMEKVFYPMVSLNYKFSASEAIADVRSLFGYSFGPSYGKLYEGMNFLADEEETIWNLLEGIAEKPWCELFVECLPANDDNYRLRMSRCFYGPGSGGVVAQVPDSADEGLAPGQPPRAFDGAQAWLIMRQAPFSRPAWNRLPVVEIDDSVVKTGNVGGEPTVYNVFYARSTGFMGMDGILKGLASVPLFDKASYLRYGYRPLIAESRVFPVTEKQGNVGLFEQVARDLTKVLYDWFAPSHRFLSGSMTAQGHTAYRVGTRLRRTYLSKRDDLNGGELLRREFYVEGVSHSFQTFGSWDTTVRVTRGLPIRPRVVAGPATADSGPRWFPQPSADPFPTSDAYPFRA